MLDVIAFGELLIDFACQSLDTEGYPTLTAHPGGAPANFLAAVNKYGYKTAMIGKVGNDTFGKMLINTLNKNGIDTEGIIVDDTVFTTLAFVTFDASGDRYFSFARKPGADTCINENEVKYDLIDRARVFHFGTLSLTSEPSRSALLKALEYAKASGKIISYDPNLREPLWNDLEEAGKQILRGLELSDIVKISDNEVEFLWGISPEEGVKKILKDYGVKLVYVTCGAKGCICGTRKHIVSADSLKDVKAVDTTGAGDIFGGTAMARFLNIGKAVDELTEEDLKEIISFACAAAGVSTERSGGISSIPSCDEVEARRKAANA